jgi:predicted nucleotidyltransferase
MIGTVSMRALKTTDPDPEQTVARTLVYAVEQARLHLNAKRVWLFGSRARGSARRLSDIDIAVEAGEKPQWGWFAANMEEHAPTLLHIDLVDMASCGEHLRSAVLEEGILLYG